MPQLPVPDSINQCYAVYPWATSSVGGAGDLYFN